MTNHYIAKHDGVTFTRSSANRVYAYMVVAVYNIAEERADTRNAAVTYWLRNRGYMQESADGKHPEHLSTPGEFHPSYGMDDPVKYAAYRVGVEKRSAERVASAKAWLAAGEAGLVAEYLERFDANLAEAHNISSDGKSFYNSAGWCGRLDLAEKLAGTVSKRARVVILEAVKVAAKPKNGKRS